MCLQYVSNCPSSKMSSSKPSKTNPTKNASTLKVINTIYMYMQPCVYKIYEPFVYVIKLDNKK